MHVRRVSAPTRTIEDIVASVVREERAEVAHLGTMRALLGGCAAAFTLLLVAGTYFPEISSYLTPLEALGPPLRVLLVLGVAAEGFAAAVLLHRHEESTYPLLVQASATAVASAGAILLGVGALLAVLYTFLLGQYWPDWILLAQIGLVVLLAGAGVFLAALAPAACSILRFEGSEKDG
jgi:Co/Zn/Cd efflux system component